MYPLDIIKDAAHQRINNQPADIVVASPVDIFNDQWVIFAEAITLGAGEYKRRFDITQHSIVNGLVPTGTAEGAIQAAARYASMAYLSCGLVMAEQKNDPSQIPQAKVTRTITDMANKMAIMNAYVHAYMSKLQADRSYAVNPFSPKLREALRDYYTVTAVALMELRPYASKASDIQLTINGAIEDCIIIGQKNELNLKIPQGLLKQSAADIAVNSTDTSSPFAPTQFPAQSVPSTSRAMVPYQPDIARAAYKQPAVATPAEAPTRPTATLLDLEVGRKQRDQRRLVEAAKRTNPKDPGRPPRPDQPKPT